MPGSMDGWKLAEIVRQIRPGIKVMYTSGYSDTGSERLESDAGILILEKPYKLSALAQMIRRALDAPAENPGAG